MKDIVPRTTIAGLVEQRNKTIGLIESAIAAFDGALAVASCFSSYPSFILRGTRFRSVPTTIADTNELTVVVKSVDREAWTRVLDLSGMRSMMDAQALNEFREQVNESPPEFTEENIFSTLAQLYGNADTIFNRGIVNVFCGLNRSYVTNRGSSIGNKIIMRSALDPVDRKNNWIGGWSQYRDGEQSLNDMERVFRILDGKQTVEYGLIADLVLPSIRSERGQWIETEYMNLKPCANGNLHIEFTRTDLMDHVNRVIADHFGNALAAA